MIELKTIRFNNESAQIHSWKSLPSGFLKLNSMLCVHTAENNAAPNPVA